MPESSAARRVHLNRLLADVVLARGRENRHAGGGSHLALEAARADTLQALTDYAEALEDLSWPVPRTIQMDIALHKSLKSSGYGGVTS